MSAKSRSLAVIEAFINDMMGRILYPKQVSIICNEYYFIPPLKFIHSQLGLISINIKDKKVDKSCIKWFNKDSYIFSNGKNNDFKINDMSKPFCYIQNISSSLSKKVCKYSHFDGILCCKYNQSAKQLQQYVKTLHHIPCPIQLLLFDPNPCGEFITTYTSKLLWTQLDDKIASFIHCRHNGIIGCNEYHDLFQIKLEDIDKEDFEIKKLETKNHDKLWDDKQTLKRLYMKSEMTMVDLPKNNMIFAIDYTYNYVDFVYTEDAMQCGLYNFDTSEWTKIAGCEYQCTQYSKFSAVYNYGYENIYLLSNEAAFAKYNFHKDKWFTIDQGTRNMWSNRIDSKPYIWFDDYNEDILYCAGHYGNHTFSFYDVREGDKVWKKRIGDYTVNIQLKGESKWELLRFGYPYNRLTVNACF